MPVQLGQPSWWRPSARTQPDAADEDALSSSIAEHLERARRYIDVPPTPAADPERLDGQIGETVRLLLERLHSADSGLERAELVDLSSVTVELQRLQGEVQLSRLRCELAILTSPEAVSAQRPGDPVDLLREAAVEACTTCGLDRAMALRREGGLLVPVASWINGRADWAAEVHEFALAHPVELRPRAFETEVVDRQLPGLLFDPAADPCAWHPLVDVVLTTSMVSVPIVVRGQTFGVISGDAYFAGRQVDWIDVDKLAALAVRVGHAITHQVLVERLRAQGQQVQRWIQETESIVRQFYEEELGVGTPGTVAATPAPAIGTVLAASRPSLPLSPRELEILRLMAAGATNDAVAWKLALSPWTVKTHVKNILRKLEASNRAEAVYRFTSAATRDPRVP